jgi:hypothetical protein
MLPPNERLGEVDHCALSGGRSDRFLRGSLAICFTLRLALCTQLLFVRLALCTQLLFVRLPCGLCLGKLPQELRATHGKIVIRPNQHQQGTAEEHTGEYNQRDRERDGRSNLY